jgi:hypothetical protein
MQTAFGSGVLWGTPLTDINGNAVSNPTPIKFGIIQDVSLDASFDVKELYGQYQFALDIARGKGKIQGKAKFAQILGLQYASLFFGVSQTNGNLIDYVDTTGVTVANSVNIAPANSGNWAADLGIVNSSGVPLTRVANSPLTGQYSVVASGANGAYTFNSADANTTVYINYQYTTANASTGKTLSISNTLMGYSPNFQIDLYVPRNGKNFTLSLLNCTATKLSLPTKLDDFMIQELDFSAFANGAGQVLKLGTTE